MIGVPSQPIADRDPVDATIIALKSRTIEPADAVRQSLAALDWLRDTDCDQFFFKYCSTFDSTEHGNIGPVIDALMDRVLSFKGPLHQQPDVPIRVLRLIGV